MKMSDEERSRSGYRLIENVGRRKMLISIEDE
jgi:hypothetical protein